MRYRLLIILFTGYSPGVSPFGDIFLETSGSSEAVDGMAFLFFDLYKKEYVMQKKRLSPVLIKVGIVDDHRVVSETVEMALNSTGEISVLFNLTEGTNLLQQLYVHRVDVLLLDIKLEYEDGISLLKKVRKHSPAVKVIMFSFHSNHSIIRECYQLGAKGYFQKGSDFNMLKDAIHEVYNKDKYIPEIAKESFYNQVMSSAPLQDLINCGIAFSTIEKEMMRLFAKGYESDMVAREMNYSPLSIKTYRKKLLEKTKCKNMVELISFAHQHNIILAL